MKIISILFVIGLFEATPSSDSIVVIVNIENPISQLTIGEVRSYWMRRPKKRWEAINRLIKPVDRRDKCEAKKLFYNNLIKMSEESVESYFSSKQYQNGENPPFKMRNDAETIEYVSTEVGAIGYVMSSSITQSDLLRVKIVLSL